MPFDQTVAKQVGQFDGRRRLSGAYLIALDRIEPDPDQPRKHIDPIHLQEMTASVREHGVLQPISVRFIRDENIYRIVAGECRFRAAQAAELPEIPCWVKSPDEQKILLEQIIENWLRSDLNPFELADSLAILRDANGFSQQQLAAQTGKSKGEISKLLAILEIDTEVQRIARDDTVGRISKRHLYALSRLPVGEQGRLIARIQQESLTADELEREATRHSKRGTKKLQPRSARRVFNTSTAQVVFTSKGESVPDNDLLTAIAEIKQQLLKQDS